ncbi:MAG: hypothetical protein HYT11_03915 [Candidatus Levybacteria bacterium]|nr:hypothetical protein [Candidatus Levybacteria bacterium]
MLSLHKATELTKKLFKISLLIIIFLIFFVYTFRLGKYVKDLVFPPQPIPPSAAFGKLPQINFPQNVIEKKFTYNINTITGDLPSAPGYPFKTRVYKMLDLQPSLLNLDRARTKAKAIGFSGREIALSETDFKWIDSTGPFPRELNMNTITFNFKFTSPYKNYLYLFPHGTAPDEQKAKDDALAFLSEMQLFAPDIDFGKAKTKLLELQENSLSEATSLSEAQLVSVNFYQKNIKSGREDSADIETQRENQEGPNTAKDAEDTLPIYYPNPPNSTINFIIGGIGMLEANYSHQTISELFTSYPLKTASEAYEELVQGKAFIAAFPDNDEYKQKTEIKITNVSLGYYIGIEKQEYLMPVVVFENRDGFFAYVSAVQNSWIKE